MDPGADPGARLVPSGDALRQIMQGTGSRREPLRAAAKRADLNSGRRYALQLLRRFATVS